MDYRRVLQITKSFEDYEGFQKVVGIDGDGRGFLGESFKTLSAEGWFYLEKFDLRGRVHEKIWFGSFETSKGKFGENINEKTVFKRTWDSLFFVLYLMSGFNVNTAKRGNMAPIEQFFKTTNHLSFTKSLHIYHFWNRYALHVDTI